MLYILNTDYVRYEGLPIGTKVIAKTSQMKTLEQKKGLIILKEKIYKEFINNKFFDDGEELEEWYIKMVLSRHLSYSYNKKHDLFVIRKKIYKFWGYSYGCEYENKNDLNKKTLLKVNWNNIKCILK